MFWNSVDIKNRGLGCWRSLGAVVLVCQNTQRCQDREELSWLRVPERLVIWAGHHGSGNVGWRRAVHIIEEQRTSDQGE